MIIVFSRWRQGLPRFIVRKHHPGVEWKQVRGVSAQTSLEFLVLGRADLGHDRDGGSGHNANGLVLELLLVLHNPKI